MSGVSFVEDLWDYAALYDINGETEIIGLNNANFAGWMYSNYSTTGDAFYIVLSAVKNDACYEIVFNDNGGEGGNFSGPFINGQIVPTVTIPQKTGYVFAGYYVGDQQVIDGQGQWLEVEIKDNDNHKIWWIEKNYQDEYIFKRTDGLTQEQLSSINMKAHWTPITYEIAFEGNGAPNTMGSMTGLKYDTEYTISANTLTRDYYEFDGWKIQGSETTYDDQATVENLTATNNATVTLVAQWKKKDYTIILDPAGGSINDTNFVNGETSGTYQRAYQVDDTAFALPTPSKTECQFLGWKLGDADPVTNVQINTAAPADKTYTAVWKTNQYNVTFMDDDGTTVLKAAQAYNYNTPAADIVKPDNPTKTNTAEYTYTFTGWDPAISNVTADVIYKATYSGVKNSYTVTWKDEDGTVIDEGTYEYGTVSGNLVKPANPTKARTDEYTYTFAGWSPAITDVTKDATYKATFTSVKNKYNITWKNEDGTTIKTDSVEYGTAAGNLAKPDAPTKAATAEYTYSFAGWSPALADVTGPATYTSTFTGVKNKYNITWKDENNNTIRTDSVEYGTTAANLSKPDAPVKDSTEEYTYTFAGWSPAVADVTGAATYKATYQQEKRKYSIKWVDGNGKTIKTDAVEYGTVSGNLVKPEDPAKAATAEYTYTFTGWEPAIVDVKGDASYTAVYSKEKNKYEVKWVDGDGKTLKTETLEYGVMPKYDGELPTKSADANYEYAFDSKWTPQIGNVTGNATYTAVFTQTAIDKSGASGDKGETKESDKKIEDPFLDTDESEADVKGMEFGVLFPGCGKVTATSIELKWKKVDEADAYYIYGSLCNHANRKYTYKRLATITDKNQTRWTAKKLKKKSYYKFYIVAVRYVNGEEVLVSKSKRLHITTLNKTYGDATGLKVTAPKKVKVRIGNKYLKTEVLKDRYTIILKHGQTIKIKAKEFNKNKKIRHHKTIGFESSKPSVAVLSQIKRTEGYRYMKIRGGKRGRCQLYIYAQNGKYITLNIDVK
ncbi:MAG: InlB B-repeat-containing protein [Lachnospiraceae bacterium]|nr:InlB B-repeat-containing protein [Lachnospiraceae bacterium]